MSTTKSSVSFPEEGKGRLKHDNPGNRAKTMFNTLMTNTDTFLSRHIPPEKRQRWQQSLAKFANERPYLAAFILSQLAICIVPVLLMTTMAFISTLFTGIFFATLGVFLFVMAVMGFTFLVLTPILVFSSGVAIFVWFWGVVAVTVVRWLQRRGDRGKAGDLKEAWLRAGGDVAAKVQDAVAEKGMPQRIDGNYPGHQNEPLPTNKTLPVQNLLSSTNQHQQAHESRPIIVSTEQPQSHSSDGLAGTPTSGSSSPDPKASAAGSADNQTDGLSTNVLLSKPV